MTQTGKIRSCSLPIASPEGEFVAHYSAAGLCGLDFPRSPDSPRMAIVPLDVPARVRQWHRTATAALSRVLAGQAPGELPPLDLSCGTAFQQSVWQALRRIAPGKTRSYGEVAQAIGRPKATRAVGTACGANPIPVFVPCHRVLAAGRKLGGFSAGLKWKRLLLGRECVAVA